MTPDLASLPPGCAFAARCPRASALCGEAPAISTPAPLRQVRCFHPGQLAASMEPA
jgi:peptide/nickel transport system ATP-binding protein